MCVGCGPSPAFPDSCQPLIIFILQKNTMLTFNLGFQYEVLHLGHLKVQRPTELLHEEPGE